MGVIKRIFWPDHPRDVTASKGSQDLHKTLPRVEEEHEALTRCWNHLSGIVVQYDDGGWRTGYDLRPVDESGDYNWNIGNWLQFVSFFERLGQRVPGDISQGMPRNVIRQVVIDYRLTVTHEAIIELVHLIERGEGVGPYRSPATDSTLYEIHCATDRYCTYQIAEYVADTARTRCLWSDFHQARQKWDDLLGKMMLRTKKERESLVGHLFNAKAQNSAVLEDLGWTEEMFDFLGDARLYPNG